MNKYLVDAHTHTLASGHAYSTITEMITAARARELKLLAITEHGPRMPGSCHDFYFDNLKVLRRHYDDLEVMFGVEANILDFDGRLDIPDEKARRLDLVIASLHIPCITPGSMEDNTRAYLNVMKNPLVSIIGHPDDSRYPVDYERLVPAARNAGVLIEINNSSLSPNSFRPNTHENDIHLLTLCKEYHVPVILNSDAHVADDVGNFTYALPLLKETGFPNELVINTQAESLKEYIRR